MSQCEGMVCVQWPLTGLVCEHGKWSLWLDVSKKVDHADHWTSSNEESDWKLWPWWLVVSCAFGDSHCHGSFWSLQVWVMIVACSLGSFWIIACGVTQDTHRTHKSMEKKHWIQCHLCANKHKQTQTSANKHKQTWTNMNKHKQTWTNMNKHEQTWTNMNKHEQTQTNTKRLHISGKCSQFHQWNVFSFGPFLGPFLIGKHQKKKWQKKNCLNLCANCAILHKTVFLLFFQGVLVSAAWTFFWSGSLH